MIDDKFWNEKSNVKGIRVKVADFVATSPLLKDLKDKSFLLENAIINFIKENRELIRQECDREDYRDDVIARLNEIMDTNLDLEQVFPIEFIDDLVQAWQSCVGNNETYWEAYWESLEDVVGNYDFLVDASGFSDDLTRAYFAYINEYLICSEATSILDMEDFVAAEIQADCNGMGAYYIMLGKELKER